MKLCLIRNEIADLNAEPVLKNYSLSQLKRVTDILIIDDDPFTYEDALKKNEFMIDYKSDIQSLKEVEAYSVILCDIMGVGKFLQSQYEGAYLVQQIKGKYPHKTVIIYSGNQFSTAYQEFLNYADHTMQKGATLEKWNSLLTQIIRDEADPVKQWAKTRSALLDAGLSIVEVAKLEDKYVRAIKNSSYESLSKLAEDASTSYRHIITELLSSTIAKLLKG